MTHLDAALRLFAILKHGMTSHSYQTVFIDIF